MLTIGRYLKYIKYIYCALFFILILTTLDYSFKSETVKKILKISDRYSYTFYLSHGIIFIHCLDRVGWNRIIEGTIAVFGSLLLTVIINHCIETPLKKFFKKNRITMK